MIISSNNVYPYVAFDSCPNRCNSIYHPFPKLISTRTGVWPATSGLWWNTVCENWLCGSARNWTVKLMRRTIVDSGCPADGSRVTAAAAVGVAIAITVLTFSMGQWYPWQTWLLPQYRTGDSSAHPCLCSWGVTSQRTEEVSFGRTDARPSKCEGQRTVQPFSSVMTFALFPTQDPSLVFLAMWLSMFPFWSYRSLDVNTMFSLTSDLAFYLFVEAR